VRLPLSSSRLVAFVVAAAAPLILVSGLPAAAMPSRPTTDDVVLERLQTVTGPVALELRRLRLHSAQHRNPGAAIVAAEGLLALGLATQDPRYVGHAGAILWPWWTDPAAPPAILVLRATIKQNRHDFAGALADLDMALKVDPREPRAWASKAMILLVEGRPEEALGACVEVERWAASISGTICQAAALARLGRAPVAFALLDTALARSPTLDPAIERWARIELAAIARLLGRNGLAEEQLRTALRLEPQDAAAATALAELLLDQGRSRDALAVLGEDLRHDGKLLRMVLALRALGDPAWRQRATLLLGRFAAARERGDSVHLREEARLHLALLDQPAEALKLAEANWQVQREPWDARLLLASAAAVNAPDAAEPVLACLDRTGLHDPALETLRTRLAGGRP
jgi:tetratricopeptide (TPR) repeat protein